MRDNTENFEEDHYVTLDRALFSFLSTFFENFCQFHKIRYTLKIYRIMVPNRRPLGCLFEGASKRSGRLNFRPFIKGGNLVYVGTARAA